MLYIKNMNGKNNLSPNPLFLLCLLSSPSSLLSSLLLSSPCYSRPLSQISSLHSSFLLLLTIHSHFTNSSLLQVKNTENQAIPTLIFSLKIPLPKIKSSANLNLIIQHLNMLSTNSMNKNEAAQPILFFLKKKNKNTKHTISNTLKNTVTKKINKPICSTTEHHKH